MLHEILLSLSGHPSPLLQERDGGSDEQSGITPPERQLLAAAANLSRVHMDLIKHTAQIATSHESTICRAVATAIQSIHLSAFQRKVLEVEAGLLREDAKLVGEYNIVPLTAVVGEFTQWTRRFQWLWDITAFMLAPDEGGRACRGSQIMNRLRAELQSGYRDVEDAAMSLVTVAETAWLKQVAAWVLYGRLPSLGGDDFFVRHRPNAAAAAADADAADEYAYEPELLPSFVSPHAAASMLFVGKSLNHARVKATVDAGAGGLDELSAKLRELGALALPINGVSFSRTITSIRLSLSQNILQKILPTAKVVEMMQLLRDFFLLGRGEFAMALTQEADEKIRSRWRRTGNLAHLDAGGGGDALGGGGGDALGGVTLKNGEVAAVLARTWAVLVAMQRHQVEEDEQLELARDLLRLQLTNPAAAAPIGVGRGLSAADAGVLNKSPFGNLLFSVPAALSIQLPSPLDMVISPSDLQLYSCVNSYLLGMRRAHIRLTDLWKTSSLRRLHPAPRGATPHAGTLRRRWSARASALRSTWTTASAAIFFLGETEAYLQTEVVEGLWDGFHAWMTGRYRRAERHQRSQSGAATPLPLARRGTANSASLEHHHSHHHAQSHPSHRPTSSDASVSSSSSAAAAGLFRNAPDPQTLATAHALYLRTLAHRLLMTQPRFTALLHALLIHIDHLVAHILRLQSLFTALDLETDAGVLASFADLEAEEAQVFASLRSVEGSVRTGIEHAIAALRELESDPVFLALWEGRRAGGAARDGGGGGGGGGCDDDGDDEGGGEGGVGGDWGQGERYVPARLGGINRLLMKLHFGTWIETRDDGYD
ncbi:Gamma-tubulin complex component 4 [Escovopsis weberi]|uniref:Spindle pole body component n=1 Tax=Escovopsis weberi TaxID=150374 RepID=A0A0M9VV31_ESCWE|nr:Gamma-tubulin complex component 4 [Escovopsis weberi]